MARKNLAALNAIAKADDLELIKGEGYFYWVGISDQMALRTAGLYSSAVYTCHFNQAPFDYWLRELEAIKIKLANEL